MSLHENPYFRDGNRCLRAGARAPVADGTFLKPPSDLDLELDDLFSPAACGSLFVLSWRNLKRSPLSWDPWGIGIIGSIELSLHYLPEYYSSSK